MVGPIIDELSTEYEEKVVIGKVDVDANQEFAAKYGVRNIPTVWFFITVKWWEASRSSSKQTYADSLDALL
jgi:thioredoxin 1